jgi:hypothetical protein
MIVAYESGLEEFEPFLDATPKRIVATSRDGGAAHSDNLS